MGTSTSAEGKEYFESLRKNRVEFQWRDVADSDALKLAFAKGPKFADSRKRWIAEADARDERGDGAGGHLDHKALGSDRKDGGLRYSDFVNKELILFSRASNVRAIPLLMDGLKPVQRKILWIAFKRNLTKELRVASFAGSVIELSSYHHGEKSMCDAIVEMAQDYVGANNINLLVPAGQFGTRAEAGKNYASPRYINTHLAPLTRLIYRPEDDPLLTQLNDDGTPIEPAFYLPVLPMAAAASAQDGPPTSPLTTHDKSSPPSAHASTHHHHHHPQPPAQPPFPFHSPS